jgi:hypothetical protein
MKRFGLFQRLYEEASGDPPAGGAPPAFDAAAFQSALMAEVTKAITASQKTMKADFAKLIPKPVETPAPIVEAPAPGDPAKPRDPAMAALERQNREYADRFKALEEKNRLTEEESKQTKMRGEERERHGAIRASLGDFNFASDDAREDAFRALRDEVKRGEDGELYGGDFVPVKDFIKTRMASKTHLLAAKQVDSAGARANAGMAGGRSVQLEDIKMGMKPETREAAWATVRALQHELNK